MAVKNRENIEFAGFVQVPLSEQDLSVLEQSEISGDEMLLWIHAITRKGFRVAIVPDAKQKTVKATLQCIDTTSTACGWMLSGESDNASNALLVLRYKHDARMNGDWIPFLDKGSEVKKFR